MGIRRCIFVRTFWETYRRGTEDIEEDDFLREDYRTGEMECIYEGEKGLFVCVCEGVCVVIGDECSGDECGGVVVSRE